MAHSARIEQSSNSNWRFSLKDNIEARNINFDDKSWATVTVPHGWSIDSDFARDNAKIYMAVKEPDGYYGYGCRQVKRQRRQGDYYSQWQGHQEADCYKIKKE